MEILGHPSLHSNTSVFSYFSYSISLVSSNLRGVMFRLISSFKTYLCFGYGSKFVRGNEGGWVEQWALRRKCVRVERGLGITGEEGEGNEGGETES